MMYFVSLYNFHISCFRLILGTTKSCPPRMTPKGLVTYDGCATCTNLALDVADWLLLQSGKSRPTATKGIVLITDGRSNCPNSFYTIEAAKLLKQQG